MNQATLFDEPDVTTALVRGWVTFCSFGQTGVGWFGGHHCWRCCVHTLEGCAAFQAAVARGEYDERGYRLVKQRARRRP